MNTPRRLVICNAGIPHPSRGASVVLFYQYIARLRSEGFEVLNILLVPTEAGIEARLAEYRALMDAPGQFEVRMVTAEHFIDSTRFLHKRNERAAAEISKMVRQFQPDLIVCFDLMSAWMVQEIEDLPRLTWLGDMNFQSFWYNAWYNAKEDPRRWIWVPLAAIHAWHWKRIYRKVLQRSQRVIVSSKGSERDLARLGIRSRYLPYPWPDSSPVVADRMAHPDRPTFLFLGTLTGLGSKSAFHYTTRLLYPRMLREWGANGFRLLVAGTRDLPNWVGDWIQGKPEIEYLGFVEDLDGLMASCHAVVAPIDVPVGNRSRIVTAMAKGALVIAHRNTAIGNPDLRHGESCYLAGNPEEFVRYMRKAVEDEAECSAVIDRARAVYQRCFEPRVATQMLVDEIEAILT